jgi:hypothetical protein
MTAHPIAAPPRAPGSHPTGAAPAAGMREHGPDRLLGAAAGEAVSVTSASTVAVV